ncbi:MULTISPECIES: hypothetical protein [Cysteiniphilum]|uniref:hypothetical protein n=1 Tax=Cysteiniphilum TaxID=2056696 RepID=UPI00177DC977|nr:MULTISPECIES: hypothetical protein [Cysteiniphilum]
MNDNQKERLLKIAESNPELAREMLDFMKDEKKQSNEPIAVKMVKAEEDKIEITAEQKKYAIRYFATVAIGAVSFIALVLTMLIGVSYDDRFFSLILVAFVLAPTVIFSSWYFAYKAGMPTIKFIMAKHFKLPAH